MEYNFEAQLRKHVSDKERQNSEHVEAAWRKLEPIIDEAIPRYLEARQKQGPDHRWDTCYIEGEEQVGFLLMHGYEDLVYLSGAGKLYGGWTRPTSASDSLHELDRRDIRRLQTVTRELVEGGDWESSPERKAQLLNGL